MLKKSLLLSLLFTSLAVLTFSQVASAELVRVDTVLAGTYSLPSGTPSPSGAFGFAGGGLVLDFPFAQFVEIETSGLYLTSKYGVNGSTFTNTKIDLAAGLRFNMARQISINGGIFYDVLFGNPQKFSGAPWGFAVGFNFAIPMRGPLDLFFSTQYHYFPNSLDYTPGTIQPSELIFLVGFRFSKGQK